MIEKETDCDACEEINHRKGKPTPCAECIPETMPENSLAFSVVQMAGSIDGITLGNIEIVLKRSEIDDQDVFLKCLKIVEIMKKNRKKNGK